MSRPLMRIAAVALLVSPLTGCDLAFLGLLAVTGGVGPAHPGAAAGAPPGAAPATPCPISSHAGSGKARFVFRIGRPSGTVAPRQPLAPLTLRFRGDRCFEPIHTVTPNDRELPVEVAGLPTGRLMVEATQQLDPPVKGVFPIEIGPEPELWVIGIDHGARAIAGRLREPRSEAPCVPSFLMADVNVDGEVALAEYLASPIYDPARGIAGFEAHDADRDGRLLEAEYCAVP